MPNTNPCFTWTKIEKEGVLTVVEKDHNAYVEYRDNYINPIDFETFMDSDPAKTLTTNKRPRKYLDVSMSYKMQNRLTPDAKIIEKEIDHVIKIVTTRNILHIFTEGGAFHQFDLINFNFTYELHINDLENFLLRNGTFFYYYTRPLTDPLYLSPKEMYQEAERAHYMTRGGRSAPSPETRTIFTSFKEAEEHAFTRLRKLVIDPQSKTYYLEDGYEVYFVYIHSKKPYIFYKVFCDTSDIKNLKWYYTLIK